MGWTGWATVVGWAGWAFAHPIYIIVIIDVERLYPNAIIIEENYDGCGSAYLGWTGWAGWVCVQPGLGGPKGQDVENHMIASHRVPT